MKLPCHCNDFMNVRQHEPGLEEQRQIDNDKIVTPGKVSHNFAINCRVYVRMGNGIEKFTLLHIVEN